MTESHQTKLDKLLFCDTKKQAIDNILVVGTGNIAKRHIRNARTLYPNAKVTCVSSSGRPVEISEIEEATIAESIEEAVTLEPKFAVISSPAPFHLKHAHATITAGIPTLIEKPLCSDLKETTKYAFDKRIKTGVAYNLRYLPTLQILKETLRNGKLGKVSTASVSVGQYLPSWRPNQDYRKTVSAQSKLGGGALLELSHELDYLNMLFGPFTHVSSRMHVTNQLEIDVEDTVDTLLQSADGVTVILHLDFLAPSPVRSLRTIGEHGILNCDMIKNEITFSAGSSIRETIYTDPKYDMNDCYLDQMQNFVNFIDGHTDFPSSLNNGKQIMCLIDAIKKASTSNSWIKVKHHA